MNKIVIVEDDIVIRTELANLLSKRGYHVSTFECINDVQAILQLNPNLCILDINLEGMNGYSICKQLRKQSKIPIIIVTSRDSEEDEVYSMQIEADDFITKPYNVNVLFARIQRILSRNIGQEKIVLNNEIEIDVLHQVIKYKESVIELTKIELRIIYCLIKHVNNVVSREDLMKDMWDSDTFVDDSALNVNMNRLRRKLATIGCDELIETKRGEGYIIYEQA